jgi:hypothetical protein
LENISQNDISNPFDDNSKNVSSNPVVVEEELS